jgi:biopolymer transport protein ExbB
MLTFLLLQVNQTAADVLAMEPEGISLDFWDLALKGGWIMVPIALLSLIAIFIFGDRFIALSKASKVDSKLMAQIRQHIQEGNIDSALAICRSTDKPITRMIEKGIIRIGRPLNDVSAAIENVGNLEVSKLEKGLPMLASVAGGAPMIGFLGTVMGMIQAFYDMANAGNNIDVTLLSSGIYQAMVTTVAGLGVGIIAYFAYNIIVSRVESVVFKMEASTTEFMDLLNEPVL